MGSIDQLTDFWMKVNDLIDFKSFKSEINFNIEFQKYSGFV